MTRALLLALLLSPLGCTVNALPGASSTRLGAGDGGLVDLGPGGGDHGDGGGCNGGGNVDLAWGGDGGPLIDGFWNDGSWPIDAGPGWDGGPGYDGGPHPDSGFIDAGHPVDLAH